MTGYDMESYGNKIALPSRADIHQTRTVHRGRTGKGYRDEIELQLNRVAADIESGRITPEQGRAEIRAFAAEQRKGLREGTISINKASETAKAPRNEHPAASASDGAADQPPSAPLP